MADKTVVPDYVDPQTRGTPGINRAVTGLREREVIQLQTESWSPSQPFAVVDGHSYHSETVHVVGKAHGTVYRLSFDDIQTHGVKVTRLRSVDGESKGIVTRVSVVGHADDDAVEWESVWP